VNKQELKKYIESIDDLPSLPSVATSILSLLDDPNVTAAELGKMISTDQGVTLRILRMANSAYYGFPRQIGTINLAIVVLGLETVRSLTISLSVRDTIKSWSAKLPFDFPQYWKHSLYTATGARVFAKNVSYKVPGEAFVAGLVHDVGKLIIARYFTEEYAQITDLSETGGKSAFALEEEFIGADHAEIGGWLTEKWNLPMSIVEAVSCHHNPANSKIDNQLSSIINLANSYSIYSQLNLEEHIGASGYSAYAWNSLKMRLRPDGAFDVHYYLDIYKNELERSQPMLEVLI